MGHASPFLVFSAKNRYSIEDAETMLKSRYEHHQSIGRDREQATGWRPPKQAYICHPLHVADVPDRQFYQCDPSRIRYTFLKNFSAFLRLSSAGAALAWGSL